MQWKVASTLHLIQPSFGLSHLALMGLVPTLFLNCLIWYVLKQSCHIWNACWQTFALGTLILFQTFLLRVCQIFHNNVATRPGILWSSLHMSNNNGPVIVNCSTLYCKTPFSPAASQHPRVWVQWKNMWNSSSRSWLHSGQPEVHWTRRVNKFWRVGMQPRQVLHNKWQAFGGA